jgi:hypothetical protein
MQMTIGRRVAEAVGSWLHLEFCCYRAGLLSEGALKAAVGQVLSSFPISSVGARIYADFPHDALNPIKKSGRKKAVDFALILAGNGLAKKMQKFWLRQNGQTLPTAPRKTSFLTSSDWRH